jgi:histidine triad (HIT) family protein
LKFHVKMTSIFNKIIAGDLPSHKVAENDKFLAFLDISPLVVGHTLIIPKKEVDYIFDLDDDLLGEMIVFAKKVAISLKAVCPCKKIGITVIGLEVPHAHIHLVPMNELNDMNFSKAKLTPSSDDLATLAALIKAGVNS